MFFCDPCVPLRPIRLWLRLCRAGILVFLCGDFVLGCGSPRCASCAFWRLLRGVWPVIAGTGVRREIYFAFYVAVPSNRGNMGLVWRSRACSLKCCREDRPRPEMTLTRPVGTLSSKIRRLVRRSLGEDGSLGGGPERAEGEGIFASLRLGAFALKPRVLRVRLGLPVVESRHVAANIPR